MVVYDVFRFLGSALEANNTVSRRSFIAAMAGAAALFFPGRSEDSNVTAAQRKALECMVGGGVCPKVFGQHWGLWRYDMLFDETYGTHDWNVVFDDIKRIANYANTLVVHSSMFVDPASGEVYEMPENSRRMDALEILYYEVRQRHPGLRIMDKLHLEPPDLSPRTKIVMGPDAAGNFFRKSYLDVMLGQAELAERNGIEFLSVACELDGLVGYTDCWGSLTGRLREVYGGRLVYSGIPLEHETFYDGKRWQRGYYIPDIEAVADLSRLVDIMGIDFYKPLGWTGVQDVRTMMDHVEPLMRVLEDFHSRTGARFMITETGHNGEDGRHMYPWTELEGIDREEQSNYIMAVFLTAFNHRLFDGVVLYNTTCKYDITGTPAESALRAAHAMIENGMKIDI